jgi:hypothetical protein
LLDSRKIVERKEKEKGYLHVRKVAEVSLAFSFSVELWLHYSIRLVPDSLPSRIGIQAEGEDS